MCSHQNLMACVANFCDLGWLRRHQPAFRTLLLSSRVFGAVSCHPKAADELDDQSFGMLLGLLRHPKVRAVGEIGLDYSQHPSEGARWRQRTPIVRLLRLAVDLWRPVLVHCRDAYADCLDILTAFLPGDCRVHFHCFAETWEVGNNGYVCSQTHISVLRWQLPVVESRSASWRSVFLCSGCSLRPTHLTPCLRGTIVHSAGLLVRSRWQIKM